MQNPEREPEDQQNEDVLANLWAEFIDKRRKGEITNLDAYLARCPEEFRDELKQAISFVEKIGIQAPEESPIKPNARFGDFEIIREIGRGGMGVVYEARQISLNRSVALKLIAPWMMRDERALGRLHREAYAIAKLRHPNIVSVFVSGEEEGIHYIAMELLPGRGLDQCLREATESRTPIPIPTLVRWCAEIAKALIAAHAQGLIHRDIKPSNIRITDEGHAILLDFGLAHDSMASASFTRTGEFQGSPYYCSPEQVASKRISIDARTDIYSLGVTLYEAITGQLPFEGDTTEQIFNQILMKEPPAPRKIKSAISRDLETIIQTAMSKDRDDRYATAQQLASDLESLLELRPIQARPVGHLGRIRRWTARNKELSFSLFLLLVAVVVGLAASLFLMKEKSAALSVAKQEEGLKNESNRRLEGVRLARLSQSYIHSDPELAMLIAIEAGKRHKNLEINNAILESLQNFKEIRRFPLPTEEWVKNSFFVSPLRVVSFTDKKVFSLDLETEQVSTVFSGELTGEKIIKVSTDGTTALTVQEGGKYQIRDLIAGKIDFDLGVPYATEVQFADFSRDGKILALLCFDQGISSVRAWDTHRKTIILQREVVLKYVFDDWWWQSYTHTALMNGEFIQKIAERAQRNVFLNLSPNGRWITFGTNGSNLNIYDLDKNNLLITEEKIGCFYENFAYFISNNSMGGSRSPKIVFSPDQRTALTNSAIRKGDMVLWDLETGQKKLTFLGDQDTVVTASFNSPGSLMVSEAYEGSIKIWDVKTGLAQSTFQGGRSWPCSTEFSFDDSSVVTANSDAVHVWDANSGSEVFDLPIVKDLAAGFFNNIEANRADFVGKKDSILICQPKQYTLISNVLKRPINTLKDLDGSVTEIVWSDDSQEICTVNDKYEVKFWHVALGLPAPFPKDFQNWSGLRSYGKRNFIVDPGSHITDLCAFDFPKPFDPVSNNIVYYDWVEDQWVVKNIETKDIFSKFHLQRRYSQLPYCCMQPGGKMLAVYDEAGDGSPDYNIYLINYVSGEIVRIIQGRIATAVEKFRFSRDGRRLIATSPDFAIRVWNMENFSDPLILTGHTGAITAIDVSQDSQKLASSSSDGTARVWDLSTGTCLGILSGHRNEVRHVKFSNDGKKIVTSAYDYTARLWDAESLTELMTFKYTGSFRATISISPDGKWVAVGADKHTTIWSTNPLKCALDNKPRSLTPDEMDRFEIGTLEERVKYRDEWKTQHAK